MEKKKNAEQREKKNQTTARYKIGATFKLVVI